MNLRIEPKSKATSTGSLGTVSRLTLTWLCWTAWVTVTAQLTVSVGSRSIESVPAAAFVVVPPSGSVHWMADTVQPVGTETVSA